MTFGMRDDKEKRIELLLELYKMAGGNPLQGVMDTELATKLNIDHDAFSRIALYLKEEGFIKFQTFSCISLAHRGIKEVERIMTERYAEKERRVLQKLYDDRETRGQKGFTPDELAKALKLDVRDVEDIILELDKMGWSEGTDEVSWISFAGIKEIEKPPEAHISPNIVNFNAPNTGPVQIGSHQTQQNVFQNHSIEEILPKLAELIRAIKATDFVDKDEVVADLEKVQYLAQGSINEGVWNRIQTKLTAAKTTMEVAGLVYKTYPYWPQIWAFFNRQLQ